MSTADPAPVPHLVLPFVLVHGAWLWLVPLAAAGLFGAAVAIWRLRRRLRRRATEWVAEARAGAVALDAAEAAPGDSAQVAFEGRLVAPAGDSAAGTAAAASVWFFGVAGFGAGTVRAHPELAIEVDARGGRGGEQRRIVELDGPVQVVAGARAEVRRGPPAPATDDLAEDVARLQRSEPGRERLPWIADPKLVSTAPAEIHRIPAGSRVLALGRLRRVPAREHTGGYRTQAETWRLSGTEEAPIQLACAITRPASWRQSRWRRGLCLGLIFGFGLLWTAGRVLRGQGDYPGEGPITLRDGDAVVIASALPFARHRALARIDLEVQFHGSNSARAAAEEARVAALVHGCGAAAKVWIDHFQPERAARVADACGDRAQAAFAYAEVGDYRTAAARLAALAGGGAGDRAVAALTEGEEWNVRGRLATLIAGHRFDVAARMARALADAPAAPGSPARAGDARGGRKAQLYRCLALDLSAHAGDAGAISGPAGRSAGNRLCGDLRAEFLAGQNFDRFVWSPSRLPRSEEVGVDDPLTLRSMVAGSAPPDRGFLVDAQPWITDYLWEWGDSAAVWLVWRWFTPGVNASLKRYPRPATAGVPADASAVAFLSELSVFQGALADPQRAAEQLHQVTDARDRSWLAAFVAFERGRTDGPLPADADDESWPLLVRRGQLPAANARVEADALEPCADRSARALRRAVAGDGRPLAALLLRCRSLPFKMDALLQALAPRIRRGRRRLAAIEAWGKPEENSADYNWPREPCARAARAHARRDVFKWLDDRADQARWDAIYRRQKRACADAETAVVQWTVEKMRDL